MNTLINKTASAISTLALFAIGSVMAIFGFAMVGMLALFALFTVGIALLASPFLGMAQSPEVEDSRSADAASAA
jgi:hypothetical protein